jgi:hypothetical protein
MSQVLDQKLGNLRDRGQWSIEVHEEVIVFFKSRAIVAVIHRGSTKEVVVASIGESQTVSLIMESQSYKGRWVYSKRK